MGQAFGANAAGNNWQAVGGTLRRTHYQQFSITAQAGNAVRVDSISFNCNFYGTQSGTKMALVYSRNGFGSPADSTEFTDGIGPSGSALTLAGSGNFSKSFAIAQNNSGAVDYYALALNGSEGVTINGGETLTIRLYWACSSTGTPRFALLKNVAAKGMVLTPVPLKLLGFRAETQQRQVRLSWETEAENEVRDFEVERSTEGVYFSKIGVVAASNRSGRQTYGYTDPFLPESGSFVYRLKIRNADGSYCYSAMQRVTLQKGSGLKMVPSFFSTQATLLHEKAGRGALIEIYTADGRRVMKLQAAPGSTSTLIDGNLLLPGSYTAVFAQRGAVQFISFVRQ